MNTMLLKQMLVAPTTSSDLVVFDPFRPFDRETLIKEVVGLANAQVDGPRYILFGVNPGGDDGKRIVGIKDAVLTELKRAHRLVSLLVEPLLDLAFIYDKIDNKLVGALEVDGCDFGPYFISQDLSEELYRGACWQREGRELAAIDRREMLSPDTGAAGNETFVEIPRDVSLSVGFDDDPDCEYIEVTVPDSSDPPFADQQAADGDAKKPANFAQSLKETVSTMTTQMLRLGKQNKSSDAGSDDGTKQIAEAARKHYFYEACAVKVDLCIRNDGDVGLEDLSVEIGAPRVPGVDLADRIYRSPFDKRSNGAASNSHYPDVKYQDDAVFVRTKIASLAAKETKALFGTSLRLAIGPEALGLKLALQYVLRAADGRRLGDGRVKIRLGRKRHQHHKGADKPDHTQTVTA